MLQDPDRDTDFEKAELKRQVANLTEDLKEYEELRRAVVDMDRERLEGLAGDIYVRLLLERPPNEREEVPRQQSIAEQALSAASVFAHVAQLQRKRQDGHMSRQAHHERVQLAFNRIYRVIWSLGKDRLTPSAYDKYGNELDISFFKEQDKDELRRQWGADDHSQVWDVK